MKVLHVGKYFPPFAGGIENFLGQLVAAQQASGIDSHVLVHDHQKPHSTCDEAPWLLRAPSYGEFMFTPISPGFAKHLRHRIRLLQPDIIHYHAPNPAAFWSLLMPAALKTPSVVHWHSDVVSSNVASRLKLAYPFYRPFETRLLRAASGIIATSRQYATTSQALKPFQEKVHIIPLGLNPNSVAKKAQTSTASWQGSGEFKILSVGRLTYYKGFDFLIKAMTDVANAQLVIVGEGSELASLQRLVKAKNLCDRVQFLTGASDAERNTLLHQCDVVALPSIERTEAFGLVLLEAMAAAKPVVATDIPGSGAPWVVQQGGHGIRVQPGSSEALAKALNQLKENPQARRQYSENAARNFPQLFDITAVAGEISSLYETLIQQHRNKQTKKK